MGQLATYPRIAVVHEGRDSFRVWRTIRALKALSFPESTIRILDLSLHEDRSYGSFQSTIGFSREFQVDPAPLWILRAGVWPTRNCSLPPPSLTRNNHFGFGGAKGLRDRLHSRSPIESMWSDFLAKHSGPFTAEELKQISPDSWMSIYLGIDLAQHWIHSMELVDPKLSCWDRMQEVAQRSSDIGRWQGLDVHYDSQLRIVQIITSLQRGGAEKIAIDLHRYYQRMGATARLIALGDPTRSSFPTPSDTIELKSSEDRSKRLCRIGDYLNRFRADIVHGHLLQEHDHLLLAQAGIPIVATVHNAEPGWPPGIDRLGSDHLQLWIACSKEVERDLIRREVRVSTRTVWNGIDLASFKPNDIDRKGIRRPLIDDLGIEENAILVLALANPRPQKRLERIPEVLRMLQDRLEKKDDDRKVYFLLAGEASQNNRDAMQSLRDLERSVVEHRFEKQVRFLGAVSDVKRLLHQVDILLSTSDFEGLSLAHLEAIASHVPVIATDAGGTREIAEVTPWMTIVAKEAAVDPLARAMEIALEARRTDPSYEIRDFEGSIMADRYRTLYTRAIGGYSKRKTQGVLLITNNFSTGGAQSSARRLLREMHRQMIAVSAVVLQEHLDYPTRGAEALRREGIPVESLPVAGTIDPKIAVLSLLERLDPCPPQGILLWNVIPEYKILIADLLFDVPLFDVSPGEMNFQSLEKYFQKRRPGLPYRNGREYGERLRGAVVKFEGERVQAESYLGVPVTVIPNGVPLPVLSRRSRERSESIVVGTSARLSPQKKLEDLLDAFRLAVEEYPGLQLRIAGGSDGNQEEYVQRLKQQSEGLPVEWLGDVSDIDRFLQGLDIFAMISEPAGCPNASLEAMSHGLPIVATDVGGAREQVVDGVTGILIPRKDLHAFANAMVYLAMEKDLRERMGRLGRQRICDHFSLPKMVEGYRQLLGL